MARCDHIVPTAQINPNKITPPEKISTRAQGCEEPHWYRKRSADIKPTTIMNTAPKNVFAKNWDFAVDEFLKCVLPRECRDKGFVVTSVLSHLLPRGCY